jgi:hypothetical protein
MRLMLSSGPSGPSKTTTAPSNRLIVGDNLNGKHSILGNTGFRHLQTAVQLCHHENLRDIWMKFFAGDGFAPF